MVFTIIDKLQNNDTPSNYVTLDKLKHNGKKKIRKTNERRNKQFKCALFTYIDN